MNEYNLGQTVYLKTDLELKPRMITAITIRPGAYIYGLTHSDEGETWHHEFEIQADKAVIVQ